MGEVLPSTWVALESIVQLHKMKLTKIPHLKKYSQNKQHLQAEMAVSRKYLEGARDLLCSSEYLMHSVIFLTKWAPRTQKSEPRSLPCFLQKSILASTDPCLAHRIWVTNYLGNGVIGKQASNSDRQRGMLTLLPTIIVCHTPRKLHHVASYLSPWRFSTN